MRVTYISWAPYCSRSDYTARELGGTSHMVYWGWLGSHPATVWLKYIGQTLSTWKVLLGESPEVVFVMTPPPVAIAAVYAYCALKRIPFVVDAHSGVFLTKRWRSFQRFQYWFCRRAATTIVTNAYLADLVKSHGGRATVVPDVPIAFEPAAASSHARDGFTVACVTSFDRDEPIAAMIEAARRVPDVRFVMTGDPPRGSALDDGVPPNLVLSGFLSSAAYGALIRDAGAVIALTTDDHTMQRAAYEAIYQGTPVIVSDTALLRQSFDEGAVHVDNSPEAIARAVVQIRSNLGEYKRRAQTLRDRKSEAWVRTKAALLEALEQR